MDARSTLVTENPKTCPEVKEIWKVLKNTILFIYER